MDPIANLREQRALAAKMSADFDKADGNGIDQDEANRLAELVQALDEWRRGGGFDPYSPAAELYKGGAK
jgi:hypothetical protein